MLLSKATSYNHFSHGRLAAWAFTNDQRLTGPILHGRGGWRGLVTLFHHNFPTSYCETSLTLRAISTLFLRHYHREVLCLTQPCTHKWNSIIRCLAWRPEDQLFTLAINLMESFFFCVSGAWKGVMKNCNKKKKKFFKINTDFYLKRWKY